MAVCLLFCSGMVKADVIKTIGKTDNTTAYNGAHSDYYKLQKGETYHFVFKNYNAGNGSVWDNWMIVCANAEPNAQGYKESYRLRADKWDLIEGEAGRSKFGGNFTNYVAGNNGAIYDMYVEYTADGKFNVDATLITPFPTEETWTYTGTADLGLDEITVFLTVEKAHIDLYKATKETKASIIKTVGNRNNKDEWGNKQSSDKYTLTEGNAFHFVFDNYSSMAENWKNWLLGVANSAGNDMYLVRADNYVLDGTIKGNTISLNSGYNWDTFKSQMNASTVDMTVTYLNKVVTMAAKITTSKGDVLNYTATSQANISGDLKVYLTEEGAHLDIRKAELLTGTNMTIGDAKTGTFCAPYAITLPAGVTAYTANVSGEWATMTLVAGPGEELTACTPVIVKSENAVDERFYGVSTTNDATCTSNDLVGILKAGQQLSSDASNTYYALQNGSEGIGFYVIGSNYSVKANRAYLKTTSSQANIRMRFEEETGIKAVESTESDVKYNLSGLRVDSNYKGIVIKNGKKVLVK